MKKRLLIMFIAAWLPFCSLIASAHPGRTDSNGGHTNHSTGEYHYHHGYSAHSHYDMDGDGIKDCPYNFKQKSEISSNTAVDKEKAEIQEKIQNLKNRKKPTWQKVLDAIGLVYGAVFIGFVIKNLFAN